MMDIVRDFSCAMCKFADDQLCYHQMRRVELLRESLEQSLKTVPNLTICVHLLLAQPKRPLCLIFQSPVAAVIKSADLLTKVAKTLPVHRLAHTKCYSCDYDLNPALFSQLELLAASSPNKPLR
uniref:Uncharacterized protein n=1 Tax=Ditylenchus dipsaci TaxID=166011 RepID=A0A915CR70_9BILA